MHPIVQGNIDALKQALSLLRSLTAQQYRQVCRPYLQSSIGTHCRHILDNYLALISALDCATENQDSVFVDYNLKRRQHALEQDKSQAIAEFSKLLDWLQQADLFDMIEKRAPSVQVRSEVTLESENSVVVPSTLARELTLLSSHAIHHFAIIAISVRLQSGEVDPRFGLAATTASYQRRQGLQLVEQ
ncbi:hypothetical protein [Allohahella sp. A8]|uniref:hypothetical protein n=1 Tax=Allohahella sp. A8 TaxID=3141461 RepID=UPI000C09360C|nr:hypothetical protein [Hahellaceae bacterium]|tara:strand:+ start:57963 stop:58526 length:564 start_codon:yes stop_codon:yes gene_type:complete